MLALLSPRFLIGLALAIALTFTHGFAYRAGRAAVRAEYTKQAENVNVARAVIAPPIVQKEAAAQVRIRTVTQTIIKEVPIYVKAADCPMPGGFRVLHDAAADGQLPDAARIPDAATVPAQDVATSITENYGTCRENAARLTGLQEWVRAQADAK